MTIAATVYAVVIATLAFGYGWFALTMVRKLADAMDEYFNSVQGIIDALIALERQRNPHAAELKTISERMAEVKAGEYGKKATGESDP